MQQIDITVAYNTAERILLQLYQAIPRVIIATVVVLVLYYFGKLLRTAALFLEGARTGDGRGEVTGDEA